MNFTEAKNCIRDLVIVYYDGEPYTIEYATAGGHIRPIEGIAEICHVNGITKMEVNLSELSMEK